ncbi:MAG TPA: sulfotransferase [Chthoniobacterales bacterium]|jgi:hypothetical protein
MLVLCGIYCDRRCGEAMYIDLGLFAKAEYLAFFKQRFQLRRAAYILFFSALFWIMWMLVAVGRALDHLLFPGFKRQLIREPVFIVAPPRTGSTLTQKLLALDEERFIYNTLYQTIFPAVTFQYCFDGLIWMDRQLSAPFSRLLRRAESRWFGGWDEMHKMRFNQPEEDDGFFVYTFLTEAIYLLFLHIDELWEAGFHDGLPPEKRSKLMRFYRSCLQRRLYVSGKNKTILTKATQSSGAVESLLEAFPDAKFITLVRDPHESVASHVSVFWPAWKVHSPDLRKDGPESKAYARLAVRWFQHLFAFRNKVSPRQYYCIDYRELTDDPKATLEKLYQHFGWNMSENLRDRLTVARRAQNYFESNHKYSLEEFGLSREWIQKELQPLLDYYQLNEEAERRVA